MYVNNREVTIPHYLHFIVTLKLFHFSFTSHCDSDHLLVTCGCTYALDVKVSFLQFSLKKVFLNKLQHAFIT